MLSLAVIASFALGAAEPELAVEHAGRTVTVSGAHFALTVDASKGGEMTSLRLYDGAGWHEVLAGTFPALRFHDGASEWKLALDPHKGEIRQVEREGRAVRIHTCGVLRRDDGKGSPWGIDLRYEIHPEGAVFLDMECTLVSVPFVLSEASASFTVRPEVAAYPRYRAQQVGKQEMPFRSFRAAFGANPARSFTNEIEVIVEDNRPLSGTAAYESDAARAAWFLGRGGETLEPGFQYRNRFALGLGGAATGKPRSNVVGQRVYHVVNWLDLEHWYPAREHIDAMVDNHATMLILHHEYLLQRGSNGHPHAEYRVARDPDAMARTIDYAHAKGLRVGLYMRGVEWYALETGFFEKYCTRNLDGIYLDWHGPFAVAWHEARYAAEPFLGDRHFSEDGLYTPARAYFLLMRRLRETVGPDGFLIGHQGSFNSGVFANLGFDAYLPGETGSDRHMFSARDEAAYKGMLGGGVCMPWTLDLPDYQNAEGAAKMAVWGVYPHIVTGIVARQTRDVTYPLDPNDDLYRFVLPYWRLLATIDVEKAEVFNSPSMNVVALESSNPNLEALVYRESPDRYLVIAGNLGAEPGSAQLRLAPGVLGMTGAYEAVRVDAATGAETPCPWEDHALRTSTLPQWGIEGFLLTRR
ncbi:MAG: hypothetical protein RBT84_05360 [FCB group bacterium]|jgi:hypothetical protein|nr:hypothetical protein [FCB group bacterium]